MRLRSRNSSTIYQFNALKYLACNGINQKIIIAVRSSRFHQLKRTVHKACFQWRIGNSLFLRAVGVFNTYRRCADRTSSVISAPGVHTINRVISKAHLRYFSCSRIRYHIKHAKAELNSQIVPYIKAQWPIPTWLDLQGQGKEILNGIAAERARRLCHWRQPPIDTGNIVITCLQS